MTDLVYTRAARDWLDRLPLGDGRVGAMVGADATTTRIGLNEASAWSGGVESARRDLVDPASAAAALAEARGLLLDGDPVSAERALRPLQHRYAQAFLPVGELTLRVAPAGQGDGDAALERRLDLDTGVHRTEAPGHRATTVVSAADDGVLVHVEETPGGAEVELRWHSPLRGRSVRWHGDGASIALDLPADVAPGHEPGEPPVSWDLPGVRPQAVAIELRLRHDGSLSRTDEGVVVRGARRLVVALAVRTTFTAVGHAPGDLSEAVARARGDADRVVAEADPIGRHAAAFRAGASGFSLALDTEDGAGTDPDTRIARGDAGAVDAGLLSVLLAYGVYLLRCASRADGPPANLQGIWNDQMQPPWSSGYTLNINTPMNYWAAEATGHGDRQLALLNLLEALAERGADTAARLYGARGWVAHHNTDLWGYSLPTRGDASWSQWALGGAWLVRQFDEHRRHGSMTAEARERFRAVARGCARFLLDWLLDIDGVPHTLPSTSPENRFLTEHGPAALTRSSAMDRALIREVLALVLELAAGAEDDALEGEARAVLARIPGPRRATDGRIAEWGEDRADEDREHRHLSHLYEWFPGDGTTALEQAVAHTLDTRGDDSTGWSLAWKIGLRARLRDGEAVGRLLRLAMRAATGGDSHRGGLYPNLFAAHPPFQIDGNLGLLAAFLESLVQSHRHGVIDLLPALGPALDRGRLRGFVARPGILLDLDWERRRPARVRLAAKPGVGDIDIRLVHGDVEVPVRVPASGTVEVDWPRALSPSSDHSDRSTT